jgi:hypothetical protein
VADMGEVCVMVLVKNLKERKNLKNLVVDLVNKANLVPNFS